MKFLTRSEFVEQERERERERRRAWSFFWVTLLKRRLVAERAETCGVGVVAWWSLRHRQAEYEREREMESFWNLISKWKRRRAIEIFMGKMVFWKYEMCPILTGWSYQMWDDVERVSHKILSRMGVGYAVFWVTWRSKQESYLDGLELLGGSSFIIFFVLFFSFFFFFFSFLIFSFLFL